VIPIRLSKKFAGIKHVRPCRHTPHPANPLLLVFQEIDALTTVRLCKSPNSSSTTCSCRGRKVKSRRHADMFDVPGHFHEYVMAIRPVMWWLLQRPETGAPWHLLLSIRYFFLNNTAFSDLRSFFKDRLSRHGIWVNFDSGVVTGWVRHLNGR